MWGKTAKRREVIKDARLGWWVPEKRVVEGGEWGAQKVRDTQKAGAFKASGTPRDAGCLGPGSSDSNACSHLQINEVIRSPKNSCF